MTEQSTTENAREQIARTVLATACQKHNMHIRADRVARGQDMDALDAIALDAMLAFADSERLSALASLPSAVPEAGSRTAITAKLLGEVMQDAWGEICDDASAHPQDIRRVGRVLYYEPGHWTDLIALRLNERHAALSPSEGAIPAGMVPWRGMYGPPRDVDHDKPVMRRDGRLKPTPITGNQWLHVASHADADIVAYTPKATPSEGRGEEGISCPQIAMGHGKVDVGIIHHEGRSGLLLRPRDHMIPVGESGEIAGDYWPKPDDVVIWIDDPSGADVILSEIAPLASRGGVSLPDREAAK